MTTSALIAGAFGLLLFGWLTTLGFIHIKVQEIKMALSATEQTLISAFDTETNRIAALVQQLIDSPPTDDAAFNEALAGIVARLQGVGADGTVPHP
jgi:uncharacterized membrane protein YccC